LNLYEFAWYSSYDITGKKPGEVKILLRRSAPFPFIEKDECGYIICLPRMKRVGRKNVEYQGMLFNLDDENCNKVLWNLFKASIFYLSAFTIASNTEVYSDYVKDRNDNLALNAINLVEDAAITAYIKSFHKSLLPNILFTDAVSYLLLKPAEIIWDEGVKFVSSVLSCYKTGMTKGNMPDRMFRDTKNMASKLRELENRTIKSYLDSGKRSRDDPVTALNDDEKQEVFSEVYEKLAQYCGYVSEVPSFLYMNHLSKNSIFWKARVPAKDEIEGILAGIASRLNPVSDLNVDSNRNEAAKSFRDWLMRENSQQKILMKYQFIGNETHFKSFIFPEEDYAEFIRRKERHSRDIRRVMSRLAIFYNLAGEDFRRETGALDLQEAIQVVASQSRRTDVFSDETLQHRAQAWTILVDVSLSLKAFSGEVKDVILCLTEVARKLFQDNRSLGIFAFDDKFYVIKDFSETYSSSICARIGGIEHSGLTYLSDGIKIVAEALKRRYEETKIMIVVSDGFPTGYKHISEDTKNQIKSVVKSGINAIGIGIDSRGIRDYFPAHCVVKTPYELMKSFVNVFFQYTSW